MRGVFVGLVLFCVLVVAVECASPADYLITSLPGLKGGFPSFKQYGGYIEVNKTTGKFMYFWFTEAETDPKNSPLVVWFQGGPGCSSLYGFAMENGPYHSDPTTKDGMQKFPYGWNREANTLYIESPAGVGFSYSNTPSDYNTGDNQTALDNYHFLQDWFEVFTDYKSNDLWLTGESYAGVYVPTLTYNIIRGTDTRLKNQLKGIMLGNPVLDCPKYGVITDPRPTQVAMFYWHAMIPYRLYKQWLDAGCQTTPHSSTCNKLWSEVGHVTGAYNNDDLYWNNCIGNGTLDVMASTPGCVTPDEIITNWYNRLDVKKAIHANTSITWSECTNQLNFKILELDILNYLEIFFAEKPDLNILYYSGDVDIATVPFANTQQCLYHLKRNLKTTWESWFLPSTTAVAGYVEVYDKYTYATIKGAGHEVPQYQPAEMFYIFSHFLRNQYIPPNKEFFKEQKSLYQRVRYGRLLY